MPEPRDLRMNPKRFIPFLIGATCWFVGMIGYWLTTVGYTALGGTVVLVAVVVFPYAMFLGLKRIKEHFATPSAAPKDDDD